MVAMPNDVKAVVSAVVLIVAAVLAYWSGSPIRPDFSIFVIVTAIFMVAAMWIFPEAGAKNGDVKRAP
jgi:uncharacterized protein YqgC (DUF456 family)